MYHVTLKTNGASATSEFVEMAQAEEYISTLLYMHGIEHLNISANFRSAHLDKHSDSDVRNLADLSDAETAD